MKKFMKVALPILAFLAIIITSCHKDDMMEAIPETQATNTNTEHSHQGNRACAADDLHKQRLEADASYRENRAKIEDFAAKFAASPAASERSTVVNIPVVVHVLYNNAGQNVSDAQIATQMQVLNDDFRRLNADASNTPAGFAGIAADSEITFCLAGTDPSGNTTTGIQRRQTSVSSFQANDDMKKFSQGGLDPWPAGDYMNMWVCNISGGILGYAQFPGGPANTDGIVITTTAFGTIGTAQAPFNKGRTATHEVGHYLNLFHIWGDDGNACTGSDQVADTPNQGGENYGCPNFPSSSCNNGPNGDMFMNYMDYTDDACMNMFTQGQKTRMQSLFASGGARASLLNSTACGGGGGGGNPPPATCDVPTGVSATASGLTTATVSWAAVSGATNYRVQHRVAGTSAWTSTTTASTSLNLTGLVAGTSYQARVRTNCTSGNSANSANTTFTTQQPQQTCDVPTGLNVSNVTQTEADLFWGVVAGANDYRLQYRELGTSSWTSYTVSIAAFTLAGLAPNTTYQFRVRSNCANGNSTNSQVSNFTTLAGGGGGGGGACIDIYEPNDRKRDAVVVPVNIPLNALIGDIDDVDFFRFANTYSERNIKISLTNLAGDYDLYLYRGRNLLDWSENWGTTNEEITFNTNKVSNRYFVEVVGWDGDYDPDQCYELTIEIDGTPYRINPLRAAQKTDAPQKLGDRIDLDD